MGLKRTRKQRKIRGGSKLGVILNRFKDCDKITDPHKKTRCKIDNQRTLGEAYLQNPEALYDNMERMNEIQEAIGKDNDIQEYFGSINARRKARREKDSKHKNSTSKMDFKYIQQFKVSDKEGEEFNRLFAEEASEKQKAHRNKKTRSLRPNLQLSEPKRSTPNESILSTNPSRSPNLSGRTYKLWSPPTYKYFYNNSYYLYKSPRPSNFDTYSSTDRYEWHKANVMNHVS